MGRIRDITFNQHPDLGSSKLVFHPEDKKTGEVVISMGEDTQEEHSLLRGLRQKLARKLEKSSPTRATISELNHLVFGLYTTDFHTSLYSYIQDKFVNGQAVRAMDDFLLSP